MPLPAAIIPILAAVAGGVASAGASKAFSGGEAGTVQNIPGLSDEQIPLWNNLIETAMNPNAGGKSAFGQAGNYYSSLMGETPGDYSKFAAPMLREYFQDIVPSLSEQFAGMGSGGLSSSGFRNSQTQGAVDLAERLGALRAQLRQSGAAGLMHLGEAGLVNRNNTFQNPGSPGFAQSIAPAVGNALVGVGSDYLKSWINSPSTTPAASANTSGAGAGYNNSVYAGQNIPASPVNMPTPGSGYGNSTIVT